MVMSESLWRYSLSFGYIRARYFLLSTGSTQEMSTHDRTSVDIYLDSIYLRECKDV